MRLTTYQDIKPGEVFAIGGAYSEPKVKLTNGAFFDRRHGGGVIVEFLAMEEMVVVVPTFEEWQRYHNNTKNDEEIWQNQLRRLALDSGRGKFGITFTF